MQNVSILALTIGMTASVVSRRFVTIAGAHAAAAGTALGVSRTNGEDGDDVAVDVLGTTVVTSGAAIAKGAAIEVGADGKAVTQSAGVTVARALDAATASDQDIEVLLIQN